MRNTRLKRISTSLLVFAMLFTMVPNLNIADEVRAADIENNKPVVETKQIENKSSAKVNDKVKKDSNSEKKENPIKENSKKKEDKKEVSEVIDTKKNDDIVSEENVEKNKGKDSKDGIKNSTENNTNEGTISKLHRNLDETSLNEIRKGFRTFANGTLDLRIFGKSTLGIGLDSDGDGLKDEEEVKVYEVNGKKYFLYTSDPFRVDSDGDGFIDSVDKDPLTWDITARDGLIFSKLAYRSDEDIKKILSHDKKKVESTFNKVNGTDKGAISVPDQMDVELSNKIIVAAQREISCYWKSLITWHNSATGLDAVLFEFNSSLYPYLNQKGNYMLAFRGTTPNKGNGNKDIKNDVNLGVGRWTTQGEEVVNLGNDLVNRKGAFSKLNIKRISTAGHSLGGYLSQLFLVSQKGAEVGKTKTPMNNNKAMENVYTFNAPPIVTWEKWWHFPKSPQNVIDYKHQGDKLNEKYKFDKNNPNKNITHRHFIINGEIVTSISQVGKPEVHEMVGAIKPTKNKDNPSAVQAHYMSNFARSQYDDYFTAGTRRGFKETNVLEPEVGVGMIGQFKPYYVEILDQLGNKVSYDMYLKSFFELKISELMATKSYDMTINEFGATFKKKSIVYNFVKGNEQKINVKKDANATAFFKINVDFSLFDKVYVDGKELSKSDFIAEEGSTNITLKSSLLNKLLDGVHSVKVTFKDGGIVDGTFAVEHENAKSDVVKPELKVDDNQNQKNIKPESKVDENKVQENIKPESKVGENKVQENIKPEPKVDDHKSQENIDTEPKVDDKHNQKNIKSESKMQDNQSTENTKTEKTKDIKLLGSVEKTEKQEASKLSLEKNKMNKVKQNTKVVRSNQYKGNPNTSDQNHAMMFILLIMLSLSMAAVVLTIRKNSKNN